jgi:hypothetical protein
VGVPDQRQGEGDAAIRKTHPARAERPLGVLDNRNLISATSSSKPRTRDGRWTSSLSSGTVAYPRRHLCRKAFPLAAEWCRTLRHVARIPSPCPQESEASGSDDGSSGRRGGEVLRARRRAREDGCPSRVRAAHGFARQRGVRSSEALLLGQVWNRRGNARRDTRRALFRPLVRLSGPPLDLRPRFGVGSRRAPARSTWRPSIWRGPTAGRSRGAAIKRKAGSCTGISPSGAVWSPCP